MFNLTSKETECLELIHKNSMNYYKFEGLTPEI